MSAELENKRILNVSEAARYSGYSRGMVEFWVSRGMLPFESPPGQGKGRQKRKYIRRVELDAFLDRYHYRESPKNERRRPETEYEGVTLLPRGSV